MSDTCAIAAGKDYSLLHAAPIVGVFVLDHEGIPLPDPYEVEARTIPMPDMRHPHFAVIVSQEQIKIVSLPGMRQKRKEKVCGCVCVGVWMWVCGCVCAAK